MRVAAVSESPPRMRETPPVLLTHDIDLLSAGLSGGRAGRRAALEGGGRYVGQGYYLLLDSTRQTGTSHSPPTPLPKRRRPRPLPLPCPAVSSRAVSPGAMQNRPLRVHVHLCAAVWSVCLVVLAALAGTGRAASLISVGRDGYGNSDIILDDL